MGLQVYRFTSVTLIEKIYVVIKDSLIHVFTDLQVYNSAIELDKTLDEMFKLYLCLRLYMGLQVYTSISSLLIYIV